jgi:hypothetical protein
MPLKKSSSRSDSSRKSTPCSSGSSIKFIPNLTQLTEASKELPDPELWPQSSYQCPLEVDGKQRSIEFALKSISRGKKQTPRWIYEGKVLVRKRDT